MVKERKPSGGRTNLSGRKLLASISKPTLKIDDVKMDETLKTEYFSPTRKMLAPDLYRPKKNNELIRTIDQTAVWKENCRVQPREYDTTQSESFRDPSTRPVKDLYFKEYEVKGPETEMERRTREAYNRLIEATRQGYGTTAAMLRQFKKKQGDDITLFELQEYLRRVENSCHIIPDEEDCNILFSDIHPHNKGSIPVTSFLKEAELCEMRLQEINENKEKLEMRLFLKEHVEKEQEKAKVANLSTLEKMKQQKSIKNEQELIKNACGSRPFDLNITFEEFENSVNKLYSKCHKAELDSKESRYSRYLRQSNMNVGKIPFWDMRLEEIDKSKDRAARLELTLQQPENVPRLAELEKKLWQGSKATHRMTEAEFNSTLSQFSSTRQDSQIMENPESLNLPIQSTSPKRENPTDLNRYIFSDNSVDRSAPNSGVMNSKAMKKRRSVGETMFLRKDAVKVNELTQLLSNENTASQESVMDSSINTYTQNQLSNSMKSKSLSSIKIENLFDAPSVEERFSTTNSVNYPPIFYEPSKAPQRNLISDSEKSYMEREKRRQLRYKRREANLDVTNTRLEYEELDKKIRELKKSEGRIKGRLRYQSVCLIDNLRIYKQRPLERNAKKLNIDMATRMFGGQLDKQTANVVPDSRDFLTTYQSSYLNASPSMSQIFEGSE